ncbi:MAG TPA: hypothetical protein VFA09_27580 [Ktedonobacteraceae bacterium]|nr:hypothetical protein [Ktedonobacteraceae bacterium]
MENNDLNDLEEALQELDAGPAEIAAWMPVVQRLAEWPERRITSADRGRLLSVLEQAMPLHSAVRQAIRERMVQRSRLITLLHTARAQVSVQHPPFWIFSLLIVLIGAIVELSTQNPLTIAWLRALAPLLAYLSVTSAFRGVRLHTLEWELACPPSALQLIVARLVVVLGYDVSLGVLLSLVGWIHGNGSFLVVTLYWLMPLLLVASLALVLSLWLSILLATVLAYSSWLLLVVLSTGYLGILMSLSGELLLGGIGAVMLAVALWRFTLQIPRHLLVATTP